MFQGHVWAVFNGVVVSAAMRLAICRLALPRWCVQRVVRARTQHILREGRATVEAKVEASVLSQLRVIHKCHQAIVAATKELVPEGAFRIALMRRFAEEQQRAARCCLRRVSTHRIIRVVIAVFGAAIVGAAASRCCCC